jgi:hypothetical protein
MWSNCIFTFIWLVHMFITFWTGKCIIYFSEHFSLSMYPFKPCISLMKQMNKWTDLIICCFGHSVYTINEYDLSLKFRIYQVCAICFRPEDEFGSLHVSPWAAWIKLEKSQIRFAWNVCETSECNDGTEFLNHEEVHTTFQSSLSVGESRMRIANCR